MTDSGRLTGSREPSPSSTGLGPSGFDPERISELAAKAKPLLECEHRCSRPNNRGDGGRVVGFVLDRHDMIGLGLSEPLFALQALKELALAAIAMEARQRRDAEERPDPKDDSAARRDRPTTPSLQTPQGGDS